MPEHGVHQLPVPWAESNSRLTALFEALVIDWLKIGTISEVAEQLGLSWSAVSGVQERAVARGLARRDQAFPDAIGIDETAFQRRHQYVTVISSGDRVLHVADDRKRASLDAWYASQPPEALAGLRTVSMDMWGPFIDSTLAHVPGRSARSPSTSSTSPSISATRSTRSEGPSTRPCSPRKASRLLTEAATSGCSIPTT